jgi:hypothetical protein
MKQTLGMLSVDVLVTCSWWTVNREKLANSEAEASE